MDFTIGKIKKQINEVKSFYEEVDSLFIDGNDLSDDESFERYENIVREHIYYVNYIHEINQNNEEQTIDNSLIETNEFLKSGFDFAIKYQNNLMSLQDLYEKIYKETKIVKNQSHILTIGFILLIGLTARFDIFGVYFTIFNCLLASIFISGVNLYVSKVFKGVETTKDIQNRHINKLGEIIIEIDHALDKCNEILNDSDKFIYNEK